MGTIDPRLIPSVNRALALQNASYRIPEGAPVAVPPGALGPAPVMVDPVAEQNAALAEAQANDAAMSGVGASPESYTAESSPYGMSPPPPPPALGEAKAVDPISVSSMPESEIISEPNASYPEEGNAAGPPAPPATEVETRAPMRIGGGSASSGMRDPLAGQAKAAGERAAQAASAVQGYENVGDEAVAEQQVAEEAKGAARAEAFKGVAGVQDQVAADQQKYVDALQIKSNAYQKAAKETEAKQASIADFMAKFEPRDRRSVSQRAMGALAVFAASMQDNVNAIAGAARGQAVQTNNGAMAAELIQRGIDRDLDTQRQMMANKSTVHAALSTELGQLEKRFGNEVDTLKLARAMKIDQSINAMEAIKSRGLAGEALATADGAIAALKAQRADLYASVNRELMEKNTNKHEALEREIYNKQQAARAAAANAPYKAAMRQLEMRGKLADIAAKEREARGGSAFLGRDVQITDPDAYAAWVASKPGAGEQEKIRGAVQGYAKLRTAISELRALKEQYGAETLPDKAKYAMDQARDRIVAGLNAIKDGSVMQEAEFDRYMKQVPGAGDYTFSALPQLDAIADSTGGQMNAALGQLGASFVTPESLTRPLSAAAKQ